MTPAKALALGDEGKTTNDQPQEPELKGEGSTAEPECTCGVGTMFYSHLHEPSCPFAKAGVRPPLSESEKRAAVAESVATRLCEYVAMNAVSDDLQRLLFDSADALRGVATRGRLVVEFPGELDP